MDYLSSLLSNNETLAIELCGNKKEVERKLNDAMEVCRDMRKGVFGFKYLILFVDKSGGKAVTKWSSIVMNTDKKEILFYNVPKLLKMELENVSKH